MNAFYAVPGVVEDVPVTIRTDVQREQTVATAEAELLIQPNLIAEDMRQISRLTAIALNGTSTSALLASSITVVGDVCKAFVLGIIEPIATFGGRLRDPLLNSAVGTAVEFVCNAIPSESVTDIAGIVKRAAEIVQWFWFFGTFDVDLPGIVNAVPRPPPQFVDVENDFLAALNEGLLQATLGNNTGGHIGGSAIQPGSIFDVKLYEMSYLDRDALVNPFTPALYFMMDISPPSGAPTSYAKLMEGGTYNPESYLLPSQEQFTNDILDRIANGGDTELHLQGQTAGGKHADNNQESFAAGDLIVINPGGDTEELNQIMAIADGVLSLVAPLQYDHEAEETVRRLRSGTPAPPPPPLLVPPGDATVLAPRPLTLDWVAHPLAFVTAYDLQISSDSLFGTTIADTTGLIETFFEAGDLPEQVFYWRVRAVNLVGEGAWSPPQLIPTATRVSTDDKREVPSQFALEGNYPNPFNPQTVIPYVLPRAAEVRLVIYDVLGREVAVLVEDTRPAGRHEATFEADRLPSGIYLYRLEASGFRETKQMLLVK